MLTIQNSGLFLVSVGFAGIGDVEYEVVITGMQVVDLQYVLVPVDDPHLVFHSATDDI